MGTDGSGRLGVHAIAQSQTGRNVVPAKKIPLIGVSYVQEIQHRVATMQTADVQTSLALHEGPGYEANVRTDVCSRCSGGSLFKTFELLDKFIQLIK